MHEVQVKVVSAEILQGPVDARLDVLGRVVRVPQFTGEPDVGPGHAALADALADLGLIAIDGCAIDALRLIGG